MSLDLSATATAILKSLGDETYLKITRTTGGAFDPVLGETTGASTSVLSAVGAVVGIDSKLVDSERIKMTDKMILLDNAIAPLMTDLITFDGLEHTVVQIMEVNHAGTIQLFKVVCRG